MKYARPGIGVALILVSGVIFGNTFDAGTLAATVIGGVGLWLIFGCG